MNTASSYGNFCASPEVSMPSNTRTYSEQATIWTIQSSICRLLAVAEPIHNSIKKALQNLKTLLTKAAEQEDWGTYLAGTVLRAFVYEALVDCYGEVPYTEALDLENFPTPKYDEGQVVYEGVIAEINEALGRSRQRGNVGKEPKSRPVE